MAVTPNFSIPLYTASDTAKLDTLLNGQSTAIDTGLKTALDAIPKNYIVGLDAGRTSPVGWTPTEGVRYYSTDTKLDWVYTNSTWVLSANNRIYGRVRRSATASTFPSSSYTNVAGPTFWTADAAVGIGAYNSGWTVPIGGRYLISYEIRANGSFLAGVTVNFGTTGTPPLILASSATAVQSVAASSISAPVTLAQNDVLRLYLLAASGSPSWEANTGYFSISWLGA